MIKLTVPSIDSDAFADRVVSQTVNAMLLTPENIDKVMGNAEKYRGTTFVVMGRLIHVRKSMSKFNVSMGALVSVWRQWDWNFDIIAESTSQNIEKGLMSIDKAVRGYVTMVDMMPSES